MKMLPVSPRISESWYRTPFPHFSPNLVSRQHFHQFHHPSNGYTWQSFRHKQNPKPYQLDHIFAYPALKCADHGPNKASSRNLQEGACKRYQPEAREWCRPFQLGKVCDCPKYRQCIVIQNKTSWQIHPSRNPIGLKNRHMDPIFSYSSLNIANVHYLFAEIKFVD